MIKNNNLPRDEIAKRTNKGAMDGLKSIKTDKVAVENTFSKMRQIFSHYLEPGEKQRKQAYAALESQFEANLRQAVQQQMGASALGIRIDVEKQPQFQEEWHKLLAQLYSQYSQNIRKS